MTKIRSGPMIAGIAATLVAAALVVAVDDGGSPTRISTGDVAPVESTMTLPGSTTTTSTAVENTAAVIDLDPTSVAPLSCHTGAVAVVLSVPATQSASTRSILARSVGVPVAVVARDLCSDERTSGTWRTVPTDLLVVGPFLDREAADGAAATLRQRIGSGFPETTEVDTLVLEPGSDIDPSPRRSGGRGGEFDRVPLIRPDDED